MSLKNEKTADVDFDVVWAYVEANCAMSKSRYHGLKHWKNVESNGMVLALETVADIVVVRLFAIFHDSQRMNESRDDGHGARGAEFASKLNGALFSITEEQMTLLYAACRDHTDVIHTQDPTIGTCWDADRLDLPRVGIKPRIEFFNTAAAKKLLSNAELKTFPDCIQAGKCLSL